jgi:hypothetical protein
MSLSKSVYWAFISSLITLSPLFTYAASIPAALDNPVATCANGSPQITLSWSAPIDATKYSVFRNTPPSTSWQNISSRQVTTSYIDKSVVAGTLYRYQVKTFFGRASSFSTIVSIQAPSCTSSNPPTQTTTSTSPLPTSSEIIMSAYITGYGWPDNTPASADISNGVIHTQAGGTGTYSDPVTIAVGHSIINARDILDYPEGTKFYIPALHRYFIVEDTCGDGNTPQNGPCHTGFQGKPWLDVWVGGQNANTQNVLSCEDAITNVHTIIKNPVSNYLVTSGPIFGNTCTTLYSETPQTN